MSTPVRILLVEDEFVTLDTLRDNLEEMGYAISGDAMRAEEAIPVLDRGATDLAILDIQLKGDKTGIWLAERIRDRYRIPFIFLTAYSDRRTVRAAAATEPSAYLVKPFTPPDLFAAIELALLTFARTAPGPRLPTPPDGSAEELLFNNSIYLKVDQVYVRIDLSRILFIEAFKNYLEVHVPNQKYLIRSTLKDLSNTLPDAQFLQPHRSYLVNARRVDRYDNHSLWIGKKEIPLSRSRRDWVLARLGRPD